MVFYYTEDEDLLHESDVFYYNGKYYSDKGLKAELVKDNKKNPKKWGIDTGV
jgi:hypothetical protein